MNRYLCPTRFYLRIHFLGIFPHFRPKSETIAVKGRGSELAHIRFYMDTILWFASAWLVVSSGIRFGGMRCCMKTFRLIMHVQVRSAKHNYTVSNEGKNQQQRKNKIGGKKVKPHTKGCLCMCLPLRRSGLQGVQVFYETCDY